MLKDRRNHYMQEMFMFLIEEYGYISLFLLMIVENVFPPIPSEIILTFAGFMTSRGDLDVIGVIVVGTCGSFLGSYILFYLGRKMTINSLERLLDSPISKKLHFQKKEVMNTLDWFLKHGPKAVFLGRLVPVIRSLISIPAGMSQMSFISFSLYTLLGTLLWDSVLVCLGIYLGQNWELMIMMINQYKIITILFIIGVILYWILKKKS